MPVDDVLRGGRRQWDRGVIERREWSEPEAVGANLASVSCPTATFCAVLDSNGRALTWNGQNASAPTKIEPAVNRGVAVSCASPTHCVAIDRWGGAVTFDGAHWSAPVDTGAGFLHLLSCPTQSFCLAYNKYDNDFLTLRDGAWSAPAPIGGYGLLAVSCASATYCVAADYLGGVTTFDGSRWSPSVQVSDLPLTSISCPTAGFCLGVDYAGRAVIGRGGVWSTPA